MLLGTNKGKLNDCVSDNNEKYSAILKNPSVKRNQRNNK